MNHLLQTLYGCVSMTNIEYQVERALPSVTADERVVLERIRDADSLDEMHALIAEALGDPQTAKAIRDARASRKAREQEPSTAVRQFWNIVLPQDAPAAT